MASSAPFRQACFIISGLMLLILIVGCSSIEPGNPRYTYPEVHQLRVRRLCSALYSPPYVEYIAPSRKRKIRSIHSQPQGILAVFADGRSYRIPLETDMLPGEVLYCNFRPSPTLCTSDHDWDERCLKKHPLRPANNRF